MRGRREEEKWKHESEREESNQNVFSIVSKVVWQKQIPLAAFSFS